MKPLGRFTLFDPKKLGLLAFQQAYQNNWLKADSFILQEGLKFPKNLYPDRVIPILFLSKMQIFLFSTFSKA